MPNSKISICNLALAALGEDSIRSFDEDNKRSRMCDVFFESTKEYLLSKFDWPFACKLKKLQPVILPEDEVPYGEYGYQIPSDCKTPRDIHPRGGRDYWVVRGQVLFCKIPPETDSSGVRANRDVQLYYTYNNVDASQFTDTFATLLYIAMAVRMAPSLTQDKDLTRALAAQYQVEMREAWESDANIGNDYRAHDEDPNNDTFVHPDIATYPEDFWPR